MGLVAYNHPIGKDYKIYKWYIYCQLGDYIYIYISPIPPILGNQETTIDQLVEDLGLFEASQETPPLRLAPSSAGSTVTVRIDVLKELEVVARLVRSEVPFRRSWRWVAGRGGSTQPTLHTLGIQSPNVKGWARGVQSPPKSKVFKFHYHSQKVIGSLGIGVMYNSSLRDICQHV